MAADRGGGRGRVHRQFDRSHGAALSQERHAPGAQGGRSARGAAQVRHPARGLRRSPRRFHEGGKHAGVPRQDEPGPGPVHVGGQERHAFHDPQLRALVPLPAGGEQDRGLRRQPGAAGRRLLPARLPHHRRRGRRRLLPGPAAAADLVWRQLVGDPEVGVRRPGLRVDYRRHLRLALAEVARRLAPNETIA